MPTTPSTDPELLARIAAGDGAALATLHDRYRAFAHAVALRVVGDATVAEDVVQDAFLAIWRRAAGFHPERGSVRTWLATIVRNRAIDLVRSPRERLARAQPDDEPRLLAVVDPSSAVPDVVVDAIERDEVRAAVRELPDDQRHAIGLAFFRGLSHSEIAERTGIPLGTVKSRIRLGIGRMRGALLAAGMEYA